MSVLESIGETVKSSIKNLLGIYRGRGKELKK